MALLTFKGGIHPDDGKSLAKDKAIVELKPQGNLVYLVSQHIGAPASPIVEVGDRRGRRLCISAGVCIRVRNSKGDRAAHESDRSYDEQHRSGE